MFFKLHLWVQILSREELIYMCFGLQACRIIWIYINVTQDWNNEFKEGKTLSGLCRFLSLMHTLSLDPLFL